MESVYSNSLSMDIQNLISCIHWHEGPNNDQVVIETLKTIIDICTNNEFGRDALREEAGLDFLVEFMFTTDNAIYLEHSLKTLACVIDENIHNQMYMTKKSVFEVIQTILRNRKFPVITRKNAIILVSAILFQNSTAQSSICEVGLLQDLLNIYEQGAERLLSGNFYSPTSDDPLNELWITSISALCFAVNNPKHETNQALCSTIFQISLRLLEFSTNADIIGSVSSLLSLCISNNRYCQDKFAQHDGLLACKRFFQRHFNSVLSDIENCNNIIGKEALQMLDSIIGIISAAALEHESNAALLGRLGIVSLLVDLLFIKTLDVSLKTKIVLSLGHSTDAYSQNKAHILGINNFDSILKENLCLGNQELSSACKYLLQVCIMQEEPDQEDIINDVNNPMETSYAQQSACFRKELASKTKSPEKEKMSKTCKENNGTKRPSSCMSSSKSQKSVSKFAHTNDYDKPQPKKSRTNSSNTVTNHTATKANKDYLNTMFATSNGLLSSPSDSFLSAESFSILNDILDSSIDDDNVSDSSSESSSPYYPAELLLEQIHSENDLSPKLNSIPDNSAPAKAALTKSIKLPDSQQKDTKDQKPVQSVKRHILKEKTNLKDLEVRPSPKKKFKFDPSLSSPKSFLPSPKVGSPEKPGPFTRTFFPCSSTHEKYAENVSNKREKAKRRKQSLSSTSSVCRSPKENDIVQVIVFPGKKCEEHNLISSFESLQVVPLDQIEKP